MKQVMEALTDIDRRHLYGYTESGLSYYLLDAASTARELADRVTEDGDDDDWDSRDEDLMHDFAVAIRGVRRELAEYQGRHQPRNWRGALR
jgi:hypothetical protein